MVKPNRLDRKGLQIRLENYKLIAEVNAELFDANAYVKEDLLKASVWAIQIVFRARLPIHSLIEKLNEVRTMIGQPKSERRTLIVRKSNDFVIIR